MLQTLRVKNLAIVEDVRVDFATGLNVITGETGAGKSILVGALGLVLGERADKTIIRAGETRGGVEAAFHLPDSSDIDAILDELELAPCEDGVLLIRRILATEGAGKTLVNDSAATVQALRRIGRLLVDMHGPHDHQSLLSSEFQLDLLDAFGHLWPMRSDYEDVFETWRGLLAERSELEGGDEDVAREIDFLQHQVREIDDAELADTREEDLVGEHTRTANAQRILELGDAATQALAEGDNAAFDSLAFVQNALREMADLMPQAETWRAECETLAVQVQELANTIGGAMQNVEGDPARLQWLEDRMALLHKLKRKYGSSIEDILRHRDEAAERLTALEQRGELLAELDAKIGTIKDELNSKGTALRKARTKAADGLAKAITGELRDLGFPHGAFGVTLESGEPAATGMDRIDFAFAPNAGEPARPLKAIASSGEISRVMLAVKAVLADHDRIPVLVFDEIDANVGGEMGNAIGDKLQRVAANHQVVCITHLPQVAAHGSTHMVVGKSVRGGRTRTRIEHVDGEERVEELGRMLGGKSLTDVTLKHAREMLVRQGGVSS